MAKDEKASRATNARSRRDGPSDDLEVLREIIAGNKGLMLRVLDKIRYIRATSGRTMMDDAKDKQDKQHEKVKE